MASLQESVICSLNFGKGLCGYNNIILGKGAGSAYQNGNAYFNTSIGFYAGRATTGACRVSLGYKAGCNSQGGKYNVWLGSLAGTASYNCAYNVAIGQNSAYFGGIRAVAIGAGASRCGISEYGVSIGNITVCGCSGNKQRQTEIGYGAGISNGSNFTVAVGFKAGLCGGYKGNNIGSRAGYFGTNLITTQIGYYAYDGNYQSCRFVIGKSGHNYAYTYVGWSNVSDSRDKTNITELPDNLGLNFIRKLRPVSFKFDYRRDYMYECGFEYGQKDGTLKKNGTNYGFLAQQIEDVAKELNVKFDGVSYDEFQDKYTLKTLELLSPIVKSIQELNNELDLIEQQIG